MWLTVFCWLVLTGGPMAFYDCGAPSAGEDLCDKANVQTFVEWDVEGSTTLRYSSAALDNAGTYYGGYMAPRVLKWGTVTRALSDFDGHWESARFSVELADTDRAIRNYANTYPIRGTALRAYLISEAGRAAEDTPRVLFAGPLTKWVPTGDLRMELHGADQLAQVLGGLNGRPERMVPTRLVTLTDFPAAPVESVGQPVPILYGGQGWYTGACPLIYVGPLDVGGGSRHTWLVAGHACKVITDLHLDGTRISSGWGSSWWSPWAATETAAPPPYASGISSNWPLATTYVDINSRRYTLIQGAGSDAEAVVAGTKVLTANVQGIEETGDGTGTLLEDSFKQYVHWLINWGLQDYQSGAWLDMTTGPTYDTGWCVINVQSFLDASTIAQSRVDGGYTGVAYLGVKQKSVRDWIADWNVSTDARLGLNEFCQWALTLLPDNVDQGTLEAFSDVVDIHESSVSLEVDSEALVGRLRAFVYRLPRYGTPSQWDHLASADYSDATALATYDEADLATVDLHLPFAMPAGFTWPATPSAAAADIAQRWLARRAAPSTTIRFRTGLCGLRADLGDVILVNHFAGTTSSGWVDRLVQVERLVIDAGQGTVTIQGRDVSEFVRAPVRAANAGAVTVTGLAPGVVLKDATRTPDGAAVAATGWAPTIVRA